MSWLSRAGRAVGRAGKAYLNFGRRNVLPVAATIAGQTLIPIPGVGAAIGSAAGGALSRGRFDARQALRDGVTGAVMSGVTSGIGSRLGIPGMGGKLPAEPAALRNLDLSNIDFVRGTITGGAGNAAARAAAPAAASTASRGIASRLFGNQGIAALSGAASAGADWMAQRGNQRVQERRIALEEEETRRQRERQERNDAALDPMREQLIQQIMRRFTGGN